MSKTNRRPQQRKRFRDEPGYREILVRDRFGRHVRRWARRIPRSDSSTPQPGAALDHSPFWPPFFNGFERAKLREDLARQGAAIFVAEAIRLGSLAPELTVDDVLLSDLDRLADEQEEFLQSVADAQLGLETDPRFHEDYEWLVAFGGVHWALARTGSSAAYDEFDDPDPRRQLIAAAQAKRFNPPYVDEDGWVRLFVDEPPTTPADVIGVHIVGTAL